MRINQSLRLVFFVASYIRQALANEGVSHGVVGQTEGLRPIQLLVQVARCERPGLSDDENMTRNLLYKAKLEVWISSHSQHVL